MEYWASVNGETYGEFEVNVSGKEVLANYVVRTIRLKKVLTYR